MLRRFLLHNTNKYASRWVVLAIDLFLVLQTFVIAYLIRFNFSFNVLFRKTKATNFSFNFDTQDFFYQQPLVLALALISFLVIGSYKGVVRHTGLKDAFNVMYAVSLLAGALVAFVFLNRTFNLFSQV